MNRNGISAAARHVPSDAVPSDPCCYGSCRRHAREPFSTAPIFDAETGRGYSFAHCSIEHMQATMAERPEFGDLHAG